MLGPFRCRHACALIVLALLAAAAPATAQDRPLPVDPGEPAPIDPSDPPTDPWVDVNVDPGAVPLRPEAWSTTGNSGTDPAVNFLGTTDDAPMEIRVGDVRVASWELVNSGEGTVEGPNGDLVVPQLRLLNGGRFVGDGSGLTGVQATDLAADSVTTDVIVDGEVLTQDLGGGAVTSAKIADGQVRSPDLAAGAVDSGEIADDAVANRHLAAGSVASGEIVDGSVTSADVGDAEIGSADLADGSVTSGAIRDGTIVSADLAPGAVGTTELATDAVTGDKIASGAVGSGEILDGSVLGADISTGAVSTDKIAQSAVSTDKIAQSAVTADKLGSASVTTDAISPQAVTGSEIATGAVSSSQLAVGSVQAGHIGEDCADEDVLKYSSGTGTWGCAQDVGAGQGSLEDRTCADRQVLKYDLADTAWECADDEDTTYDGTDFALSGQGCSGPDDQAVTRVDALGNLDCGIRAWKVGGNDAVDATTDYLGTNNPEPLELRADGRHALSLWPVAGGPPTVVAGSSTNIVAGGTPGTVVAGGEGHTVGVGAGHAVVGGGQDISVEDGAHHAVVGGGSNNGVELDVSHGTVGGGSQNVVTGDHGVVPGGTGAEAANHGELAHASGSFSVPGDAQRSVLVLRGQTCCEGVSALALDGDSQQPEMKEMSLWTAEGTVSALSADERARSFEVTFSVHRDTSGDVDLLGSTVTALGGTVGTSGWEVHVETTAQGPKLVVDPGLTQETIRWVASLDITQVR